MEFLVQIENKTNPQTWCFNPIHNEEKVVFYDNTFKAPCPTCGKTQYLYRKNNAIPKRGHFVTFKEDGWEWGRLERKHFGIVRIDCTYEQAQEWCDGIQNTVLKKEANKLLGDCIKRRGSLLTENDRGVLKFYPKSFEAEAIKNKINNDEVLKGLQEQVKQKENLAQIDYRPRKYKFDYENCVPKDKKWEDREIDSEVFELKDISLIKELWQ